jgi:hypothetical protein
MRTITCAVFVCAAACVEVAPTDTPPPTTPGALVDEWAAIDDELEEELGLDAVGLVCSGKVGCACFEVRADGTERKIVGSDYAGTCDPANDCRATCAPCTTGSARIIRDTCRVKSTTIADELTEVANESTARYATGACGCELRLDGVAYPFTATPNAVSGGFDIDGSAALPGSGGVPFIHRLVPTLPFTCEEACSYGVSSWLGLTLGAADSP